MCLGYEGRVGMSSRENVVSEPLLSVIGAHFNVGEGPGPISKLGLNFEIGGEAVPGCSNFEGSDLTGPVASLLLPLLGGDIFFFLGSLEPGSNFNEVAVSFDPPGEVNFLGDVC